jgi:hypothetical protein
VNGKVSIENIVSKIPLQLAVVSEVRQRTVQVSKEDGTLLGTFSS